VTTGWAFVHGLVWLVISVVFTALFIRLVRSPNEVSAGPNWLWRGGKQDPFRALLFREDGSFNRFGRVALLAFLIPASFVAWGVFILYVLAIFGVG
jgi:hypothetical protein